MIYAFLSDEAFAVTEAQSSVMSVSDIQKYKLGVLDDNLLNYFDRQAIISDPVGSAKATNRTARCVVDDHTTIISDNERVTATGRMFLNFDESKTVDQDSNEYLAIKSLTIDAENDTPKIIEAKVVKRAALFNIIETIFFARKNNSYPKSIVDIESILTSNSKYEGYIEHSLERSSTVTSGAYRCVSSTNANIHTSSDMLDFYDFCVFTFNYGTGTVDIKVWLSVDNFKENYPYSTITDIIYPCKPEWILEPEAYGSEMRAVLQSADYKDSILDTAVTSRDHSGLVVYKSRYVHSSVSYDAKMGFVVMYKGAIPSSESMRKAIQEKLLSEKTITGSQLADEEGWKRVLPDLFVDSGFYIFPCYYQRALFGRNIIEQNISNYSTLYNRLRRFIDVPEEKIPELFQSMEIIQAPGHGMYMVALPVNVETNKEVSLLKIHPTYQPLDSVGSVTDFKITSDERFIDKAYYKKATDCNYEFILLKQGEDYQLGDTIGAVFPSTDIYERLYVIEKDDWNTMTPKTKSFAWSLAHCVAACLDDSIDPVTAGFTVEALGNGETKREFYSFVSNFVEYHVMTLAGSKGIFSDTTTVIEQELTNIPPDTDTTTVTEQESTDASPDTSDTGD